MSIADDLGATTYDDDLDLVPVAAPSAPASDRHIPGEVGIWVFILGDMLAFALFFGVFMVERGADPGAFDASRRSLSVGFAVANTLLLLTSSLFVVMAVRAIRRGERALAPRLVLLAAACGGAFVINKALEYGAKLDAGITPATDDFFMFFYMLTGIHLLHVLIGLVVLAVLWRIARRSPRPSDQRHFEVGASYWHMVDLLWIVLFPLLYLVS